MKDVRFAIALPIGFIGFVIGAIGLAQGSWLILAGFGLATLAFGWWLMPRLGITISTPNLKFAMAVLLVLVGFGLIVAGKSTGTSLLSWIGGLLVAIVFVSTLKKEYEGH